MSREAANWFAQLESRSAQAAAAAKTVIRNQRTIDCAGAKANGSPLGFMCGDYSYTVGNTVSYLFYASLAILVVFLLLVFINFTMYPIFSFSPNEFGLITIPTASDRKVVYTGGPPPFDLSANFMGLPACTYTMGMDVYLTGDFMVSHTPRVILYRSLASKGAVITAGTVTTLATTYPDTNLIVWLDPIKNDVFVSVVLSTGALLTTRAVENVPVRKVFRLVVVFTVQFVEVYVNGKLEVSMPITKTLMTPSENSAFYPSTKPILNNVMIGNLSMWPRVLTAREIQASEGAPVQTASFFFKQ